MPILSMTTTAKNVTARLLRRHRLVDAARGLVGGVEPVETTESSKSSPKKGAIKTFSLSKNHIGNLSSSSGPPTPKDFHSTLCHMIRNAQDRVCLASLYIGVGASPSHERELELLDALSSVRPEVQVQVLLDRNRALRKVPLAGGTKTCSAQAVSQAIQFKENHELYLLQVLPSPLKSILPNPLDEVAGVFHIKAYIIDDSLILSGANLSEEYFSDRQDRYIMIAEGGAGLVDFYAQLLDLLARHGQHYDDTSCSSPRRQTTTSTTKQQLAQQLTDLFVDPNPIAAASLLQDNTVVGVAIPTFQPPPGFFDRTTSSSPAFLSDVEVTHALLDAGSSIDDHHHHEHARVQLSSAYLNPTDCLLERLAKYTHGVDLLSAGRISHGFRPKPKAGNKGKDWIPQVFDHLARDACLRLPSHAQLWHWEREGWTFHSKGLWLSSSIGSQHEHDNDRVDHVDKNGSYRLDAAMIGSGNFGARSFRRDMESNCVFVFPDNSNSKNNNNNNNNNVLSESLQSEWKAKQDSSRPVSAKELVETCTSNPLPRHIQVLFPYIKSFF